MRQGAFSRLHAHTRVGVVLAAAVLLASVLASAAAGRTIFATVNEKGIVAIDSQTGQAIGTPIPTGIKAVDLAIAPDGRHAYVTDGQGGAVQGGNVHVVDLRTGQLVGGPIVVGATPHAIAISPNGSKAYVVNRGGNAVSVIDTATNKIDAGPIAVGPAPNGIAVTPDGARAYVVNEGGDNVSVLDLESRAAVGAPIPVGDEPEEVEITPDGKTVYVTNHEANTVSVIDAQKGEVTTTIKLRGGTRPGAVAITPDGAVAYVVGAQFSEVVVIDTRSNRVLTTLKLGGKLGGLAMSPDGRSVMVIDADRGLIRIDTATNAIVGSPLQVGESSAAAVFVPDQGPLARFTVARARPGVPTTFNASASTDPDGQIAKYAWSFGDSHDVTAPAARESHVFRRPGTYTVSLQVTDDEGCSTALVFTGQTALCNGTSGARVETKVKVAFPGVRVRCPRSAGRRGCSIRLQAVTSKRHPKSQSGVAKIKLKSGMAKIVSLRPTPRFNGRLAKARRILVKETVRTTSSTQTRFARLKVVQ